MTEYVIRYAAALLGAHRTASTGHRRAWTVALDNGVHLSADEFHVDDDARAGLEASAVALDVPVRDLRRVEFY